MDAHARTNTTRMDAHAHTNTTRNRKRCFFLVLFVLVLGGLWWSHPAPKTRVMDGGTSQGYVTDACKHDKLIYQKSKDCFTDWLSLGDDNHVAPPWRTDLQESYGKAGMFFGDFSRPSHHKTIWVAAQGRSGSSLVALMMHMLGIPFGIPSAFMKNKTFESQGLKDLCFSELMLQDPNNPARDHVRSQALDSNITKINQVHKEGIANIKRMIERQNEEMDVWASKEIYKPWECLMAGEPPIYESIRDMRVIFLTRDLSGIMGRQMRAEGKGLTNAISEVVPNSFDQQLDYIVDREARLVELLRWLKRTKIPTYSIGFSRIVKDPEGFLSDLETFIGRKYSSYCKPLQIIRGANYAHLCKKDGVFADLIKKERKKKLKQALKAA